MAARFHVELIKPSHYDDDGYVIQWWKASTPANSLASVYAILRDAAERQVLGADTQITFDAYDECNTEVAPRRVARRIREAGGGLVCLVGVQSNQFPRAVDIARELRAAGIQVAIGGFHVSGCVAMLSELPADLREAMDLGIALFAGEAEGRLDRILQDAFAGSLQPLYNHMSELPALEDQPTPYLPPERLSRYAPPIGSFDAGRGCPFQCSFCTIINVQGRKSRHRTADDVELLLRAHLAQGVYRFFITDDDFARNRNWEPILDRIIALREGEGQYLRFIMQVDALAYRIPGFIDKARRAGCTRVFIGLENINPDNLLSAKKRQNKVSEYRQMFLAWRDAGIMTFAGYILGFPADTAASIERDIGIIQRELPVDILEFFMLTPLPGSEDHKRLHDAGVWMDPDMNKYDVTHVTTGHGRMSAAEWQAIYRRAWQLYYTPAHVETMLRRAVASGIDARRLMLSIVQFCGMPFYEKVHPLEGGYVRRKRRASRRPGLPRENAIAFYPKRGWQTLATTARLLVLLWRTNRIRQRVIRDAAKRPYADIAITRLSAADERGLALVQAHPPAPAAARLA